jgi:hypothetical protein
MAPATGPFSENFMETLIQQIINGLVLGSMYALVALGYTMVYGIIGLINFCPRRGADGGCPDQLEPLDDAGAMPQAPGLDDSAGCHW